MEREKQMQFLEILDKCYPDDATDVWDEIGALFDSDKELAGYIMYFEGEELITPGSCHQAMGGEFMFNSGVLRLTSKAKKFLQKDAGLGAELDVVNIKIHDETLERLQALVRGSSLSSSLKRKYLEQLQELPLTATKYLTLKLLDVALESPQKVLQLLQKSLGLD